MRPFLAALEQGMPLMAGVGVGIDRLVMLITGRPRSARSSSFPVMREGLTAVVKRRGAARLAW